MSETAVGYVDDVRLYRRHVRVREPPSRHHAFGEVFGDGVAHGYEVGENPLGFRLSHVEGDAELLDVVVVESPAEVYAAPLVGPRPVAAKDVPLPLPQPVFDANDLRPERGENAGSPRARELPGEVAHANLGKRRAGRLGGGEGGVWHGLDFSLSV